MAEVEVEEEEEEEEAKRIFLSRQTLFYVCAITRFRVTAFRFTAQRKGDYVGAELAESN